MPFYNVRIKYDYAGLYRKWKKLFKFHRVSIISLDFVWYVTEKISFTLKSNYNKMADNTDVCVMFDIK